MFAMEGNPELLVKVVRLLPKQLDADLPRIRQYGQDQQTQSLKDRSHRLKGSLGAVAATPSFAACAALNDLATDAQTQRYADGLELLECKVACLRPNLNDVISTQKA
jgi:HPt (histidine-containing phosphotransfer) domain-containing protein